MLPSFSVSATLDPSELRLVDLTDDIVVTVNDINRVCAFPVWFVALIRWTWSALGFVPSSYWGCCMTLGGAEPLAIVFEGVL
jgi:hypothetical protein